ncbi:hypothetical protein NIES2100_25850 [Calothrix sp. NIES-2100]|uniref:microviridin/marinostatin family tricyclic proteinase inhibitor n=1 Tax=Calothrix sp. NIES-2100 TaxID=1954172 RepID=UPI000B61B707|nr:hypothetical protein NIES2100_25850 [Calothrix sp. NIES-2100]
MSTTTVETSDIASDIQVLPFFAKFLQVQSASENPETPTPPPPPPFTFKFPSDWEDY